MRLDQKKKVFLKNTVMLYILQLSTYIFQFATVPWQTRRLGEECYGYLGVAVAMMMYFQLVMDFGFLLSATEDVSLHRSDKNKLNSIYTSVNIIKLGLCAVSLVGMTVLCISVPAYREHYILYLLYFIAYAVNAFLPDYLYRGLEKMTAITYRTVAVKALFTLLVFIFIREPSDYLIVPVLLGIGNLVAVVWAHIDVKYSLGIHFCKVGFAEIKRSAKRSAFFFLSRIATTVFTATNTMLLGAGFATDAMTGFYTAADRLIVTGKNAITPLSDSAYPYMVKNRDFGLVKKILIIFEPIIIVFCALVFVFATQICSLIFGADFTLPETLPLFGGCSTPDILRAMLPIGIFTLPSYLLGFPTLGALGYAKQVNYSTIVGTVVHIINLTVFFILGYINALTLAILSSIAEGIILAFRIAVLIRHRKEWQNNG